MAQSTASKGGHHPTLLAKSVEIIKTVERKEKSKCSIAQDFSITKSTTSFLSVRSCKTKDKSPLYTITCLYLSTCTCTCDYMLPVSSNEMQVL